MNSNDKTAQRSSRLRRGIAPVALAMAFPILLAATSPAHANRGHDDSRRGDRHGRVERHHHGVAKHFRKASRGHHHRRPHGVRSQRYGPAYFTPHAVAYLGVGVRGSFWLAAPYVVVHGPQVAVQVIYYPGEVPLYTPGYCPADVHYHPYSPPGYYPPPPPPEPGVHGSVGVQIGVNF